jgi:hypothetical protein
MIQALAAGLGVLPLASLMLRPGSFDVPHPAETCAGESSGLCQRGIASRPGPAIPASLYRRDILVMLFVFDVLMLVVGLRQFEKKGVS